jgi:hypothetical protein
MASALNYLSIKTDPQAPPARQLESALKQWQSPFGVSFAKPQQST